ncbi:MAG: hypothetical protein HZA84_04665 [Thaumarchaeota archaeon]|nr:hypothetical protein [Nitrososphaerota archaeon]
MKYKIHILILSVFVTVFLPAHAEEFSNPSLILQTTNVSPDEFNKISRDATITRLDATHSGSWQITIENKLLYANPAGSAVVRFYDTDTDKFIEVGMDSPSDRRLWIGLQLPDEGYFTVAHVDKEGWSDNAKIILAYNDPQGVSISNGKRVVVTNLDLKGFSVNAYSVYGMMESTDPPAINSGKFTFEILSGDVSKNPFHYFPFYVSGAAAALVGILLLIKKRS